MTTLEARIETLLPAMYRDTYQDLQPVPMRSAALRYDSAGRVAWNEIWATFCDLAMAGGPPHRGTLLQPAGPQDIAASHPQYEAVAAELCRGLHLVTGLPTQPSAAPGWIQIDCTTTAMASWLCRAIVMENVAARFDGASLGLPCGPNFRVEKEIKNVIVALAKTSHYWLEHMSAQQHRAIAQLFRTMQKESPLLRPLYASDAFDREKQDAYARRVAVAASRAAKLSIAPQPSGLWLALQFETVHRALPAMRLFAAANTIVRREGTVVCLPLNPTHDPAGESTFSLIAKVYRLIPNP